MKPITFLPFVFLFMLSCDKTPEDPTPQVFYSASGWVLDNMGRAMPNVDVYYNSSNFVTTDADGFWIIGDLTGTNTLTPEKAGYSFSPASVEVNDTQDNIEFEATNDERTANAEKIISWLRQQQLGNGLIESSENSNFVSLYDNALAAMVFMLDDDFQSAEKIFDFFLGRIDTEFRVAPGGFHWFRDADGDPYDDRWIGDNAWLLMALKNYKELTGNTTYDELSMEISDWLRGLQDDDGGLYSGYTEAGFLIPFKITEGIIDAFNAVPGYDAFHADILDFLENERWDETDQALIAWPDNPDYKYSIDNQTWGYMMFENFPASVLDLATDRLLNTQLTTATNVNMTGYDIDEDRDAIFIEGTGQMAIALRVAGLQQESDEVMDELEKVLITSTTHANASGFPYTANLNGTFIEDQSYWTGADTEIVVSTGAWYVFTVEGFNPFEVDRNKGVPAGDRFW